jgi:hypothetical protein
MIAVVFIPFDACDDATPRHPSSFGSWVKYLRPLALRRAPHDDIARYERVFIGLYDREGEKMEFFDVEAPPPIRARPRVLLSYDQFLDEVEKTYLRRNASEFEWADEDVVETDEPPPDNVEDA